MIVVWLIALIVFIVVEAATVGLVSIWFAVGAFAAFISALLRVKIWLQIACFVVFTALTIIVTRPLAKKLLSSKYMPTNADRVLNMVGIVSERIDNLSDSGAVQVGGKLWRARSESGEIIEKEEKVRSIRIEGVKLIVEKLSSTETVTGTIE